MKSFTHPSRFLPLISAAILWGMGAPNSVSAVTITLNATVDGASGPAYTVGQTTTFTLTTLSSLGLPNNADDSNLSDWQYGTNGDPPIWSTILGPTLTGAWTDTPSGGDPYSFLYVNRSSNYFGALASTDSSDGIGLFAGSEEFEHFEFFTHLQSGVLPAYPGAGNGTADNVLPASGTYVPTISGVSIYTTNFTRNYTFTIDSITFSPSAIPEPSRMVLLMAGLLATMAGRRRRMSVPFVSVPR